MPESESKPEVVTPEKALPYGEALTQTVKQLKDPPLIVAVAIGILLVAVAMIGPPNAREIILALLAADVLGVVAWLVVKAKRKQQAQRAKLEFRTGKVNVGATAQVGKAGSGDIDLYGVKPNASVQAETGDVTFDGKMPKEGNGTISSGSITFDAGEKRGKRSK